MSKLLGIILVLAIVSAFFVSYTLPFKGEGGEAVYTKYLGHCEDRSDEPFHRAYGRVYGIKFLTGQLCYPGEVNCPKDEVKIVWMCRYHIAQWIGTDPETGKRATWVHP